MQTRCISFSLNLFSNFLGKRKEQLLQPHCNRYVFAGSRSILIDNSIHKHQGCLIPLTVSIEVFYWSLRRCRMMSIIDKRIQQLYPISENNRRRIVGKLADFTIFLTWFLSFCITQCLSPRKHVKRTAPISNKDVGAADRRFSDTTSVNKSTTSEVEIT